MRSASAATGWPTATEAASLPIDYDQDDYLGAAQRYAQYLAAGDVQGIVDYAYNYEHPRCPRWCKAVDSQRVIPRKSAVRYLLLWGLISVAVFFAANPRMWSDPLGRLAQLLLYHGDYAQSAHVREYNFPFWQPLIWLLESVPWHSGVFIVALDPLIAILAALGVGRLWRKYRVFALWLAIGLGFLLIWPTKWPQYILTITVPVCLAAAEGFQGRVWEPLMRWLGRHRLQAPHPAVL